ncbi:MAG: DUF935 family protein, partial [Emcibacter sp.]|nr:DUF935 family protein [Emcibacter sp.]
PPAIAGRVDCRTLLLKEGAHLLPLEPFKFIYHTHKAKSGLPIRGGVARSVAWCWMFKNFGLKDWVIFAEVYGQPIRIGKYGPNASDKDKSILLRAVANIGTDAAAIIPDSMMIEFIKADQKGSSDLYERLCNWLDQQMSKAVLGQTTTTDAISGGHAVSKEHNEVREDIERADSKQLCGTLNRDLVRAIIDLNRGPQKRYPKIRLGRGEYTNIPELSAALEKLIPLGLKVSESEVRGKMGLKEPDSDADLLAPMTPALPPTTKAEPETKAAQALQGRSASYIAFDEIDQHVSENIDDMQAAVGTDIINIIKEVAERSLDYDDFVENLMATVPDMKMDGLTDLLARSAFNARLSGVVEE